MGALERNEHVQHNVGSSERAEPEAHLSGADRPDRAGSRRAGIRAGTLKLNTTTQTGES